MFLASPWLETYIFSNWSICSFKQFKIDGHFANFGKVKIDSTHLLSLLWADNIYFTELGQDVKPQKNNPNPIQTLSVWQKFQEPPEGSDTSHFQWFHQRESIQLGSAVIKQTSQVQSFISFCNMFFWFAQQNKICMIRIKT